MREIRMSGSVGRGLRPPYPILPLSPDYDQLVAQPWCRLRPVAQSLVAGTGPQASTAASAGRKNPEPAIARPGGKVGFFVAAGTVAPACGPIHPQGLPEEARG